MKDASVNVLGGPLVSCSTAPMTGYWRNGCCDTGPEDAARHTVCVRVDAETLAMSRYLGNDLTTPVPQFGFPGLVEGDRWCMCASRFLQLHHEGVRMQVDLTATHLRTLDRELTPPWRPLRGSPCRRHGLRADDLRRSATNPSGPVACRHILRVHVPGECGTSFPLMVAISRPSAPDPRRVPF